MPHKSKSVHTFFQFRFKDGEEILASGRHKLIYDEETETASLVIKNLCLEDTGEYNVVARNDVGSDSQFINLHVKGKVNSKMNNYETITKFHHFLF